VAEADLNDLRDKIKSVRQDLARAEGQEEALKSEIKQSMEKLREVLGCKPGKEKATLLGLRKSIAKDEAKLERLLALAEES